VEHVAQFGEIRNAYRILEDMKGKITWET